MKKFAVLMSVFLISFMFVLPNSARATIDDAKAMVEKAEAYFQANGKEKTLQELNNPKGEFVKGDLYVFAYDAVGTMVAHPINAKLIGLNNQDVPDVDGKLWRKEAIEKVRQNGSAVVDYKYKNPVSGKVEQKTTFFKKVGDYIFACGTYK
ncbi:MAG: cache domain-containing protein [Deltaproteobacteria bacterium]|nr:cache domain-containing protein [Deltaproteobacteria bacterium]